MRSLRPTRKLMVTLLLAGSLLAGSSFLTSSATAAPTFLETPIELGDAPAFNMDHAPLDAADPAVVINGQPWQAIELQYIASMRRLPGINVSPAQIVMLRGEDLAYVSRIIGAYDVIAANAREAGITLTEEAQSNLEEVIRQFAEMRLYRDVVLDQVEEPTAEEIQASYDEVREARHRVREEMRLMHIYTSTYEAYTVNEGDTLESIAEKVAGDVSAAERILSDETKRPRHESFTNTEGAELPSRALVVGEVLLVPMGGEKEAAARARIEEAAAQLAAGRDFREVAEEFSEADNKGRPWVIRPSEQDRPVRPEIHDTFFALADGETSDPIRTPHGFQIIQRVSYTPEGFRPLDEQLSESIAQQLRSERINQLSTKFIDNLFNEPGLVVINEDVLAADEFSGDDVLLTVAGEEITRDQLAEAMMGQVPADLTAEALQGLLNRIRPALIAALRHQLNVRGYFENERVVAIRAAMEDSFLADAYLDKRIREFEVSEQAIQEYYDANPEEFHRPASFRLYQARHARVADGSEGEQASVEALAARLEGITTLEQFMAVSDELAAESGRQQAAGGAMGTVPAASLTSQQLDAFGNVKEFPGLTPPIFNRGQAVSWWVDEEIPEGKIPLDEVAETIRARITNQSARDIRQDVVMEAARLASAEALAQ